ncbi:kinesin-like protein KIF19 [Cyrtonyx montezumae]|uniref:kinesin-like protein KIF19 n=1 Tax=Cyrtonyx montezumae TaxID=9017 RepID=UPI0032DAB20A
MASVQVALRIRPMSVAELQEGARPIAHRLDEQVVVLRDPMQNPDNVQRANRSQEKSYVFDAAFDSTSTQETVYRATTQDLIAGVISGCNATVFSYGPTGCGKTYTMLGTDSEPGICTRALGDLFHSIEESSSDAEHEVSMSYLEIYNETIRDLLSPSRRSLQLWEDSHGTVRVVGITEASASSAEEVLQLLQRGSQRRIQEPTATNHASSRSHAVLQLTVRGRERGRGLRCGRLLLIDLAGSERAAWTQNRGQRMKEGAHINRSLLALGNCIKALSKPAGSGHINYRDSKLTRLLKDSLGGNSHTVMIAHISPASTAFEESRSTLAYANRAKSIRPMVKHNLLRSSPRGSIVANLSQDIQHLKHQVYTVLGPGKHHTIRYTQAQVRLRDELLNACREQAALCQRLVQLEGTALHTQLVAARHLRVLTRWERRAWRWGKEGRRKLGGPSESRRNTDTDVPEPPKVITARESFVALVKEQGRLQEQKAELERCFQRGQQRTRRLEEAVQRGSSSAQQQELLALLCRLHQLQLHSAQLCSRSLLQGGPWHCPATATHPFQQHRASRDVEVSTACPQNQGQSRVPRVPTLGHTASRDSLEGTATQPGAIQPGSSPDVWLWACRMLEEGEEPLDVQRRKRQLQSFEVDSRGEGGSSTTPR